MDGCSRTRAVVQTSRKTCEKISERRVVAEMTRELHMIKAMVRGYQGSLVCCCWRRAILHERSGEPSRSIHCSSCKIGSNCQSRPKLGNIAARCLEIALQRHSRRRSSTTTNWCEVDQLSDQSSSMAIMMAMMMAMPPANRAYVSHENVRLGIISQI